MQWLDPYRNSLSPYLYAEWQDGILLCGDCLDVMPLLAGKSVDLVVTSPPYDNLRDYKGYNFSFEGIANELYRIIIDGGIVVWVVGDATIKGSETGTSFRQALYFKEIGFNLHDTMIYAKSTSPFPMHNRYNQIFEYMFVLAKGSPNTFNAIRTKTLGGEYYRPEDGGYRQRNGALIKAMSETRKPEKNLYNVWRYVVGGKSEYDHPAKFPEQLAIDHILSWSNPDDIILDPMIGSGTTAVAALRTGRRFIGIEISEEYCQIDKQRIDDEHERIRVENMQLTLFK